jgi:hypothetical protein
LQATKIAHTAIAHISNSSFDTNVANSREMAKTRGLQSSSFSGILLFLFFNNLIVGRVDLNDYKSFIPLYTSPINTCRMYGFFCFVLTLVIL